MKIVAATAFSLFISSAAFASNCPSIGVVPRIIGDTAAAYASTDGFSLNDAGILQCEYGAAFNNLGKWAALFFDSNYALALYRDCLKQNALIRHRKTNSSIRPIG